MQKIDGGEKIQRALLRKQKTRQERRGAKGDEKGGGKLTGLVGLPGCWNFVKSGGENKKERIGGQDECGKTCLRKRAPRNGVRCCQAGEM